MNASTFLLVFYYRPREKTYTCGHNLHECMLKNVLKNVKFSFESVLFSVNCISLIFSSSNHPLLITFVILINHCIDKINGRMHTAWHNVYRLTAHVTGFPRVLVTAHALVYEQNATFQLIYSITHATEQRY